MSLSVGERLGPYEILELIGAGGMGEVWKARDTRLDRMVAIKTSSEKFSERFEREARAIAALNHPNICQVYDVGPDYIVMEYVEGKEIKGPLPLDLALKAAIQLAGALEAAHRKSIIHRDLKPANILTTKSGVKVLDFGLAKFELDKPRPNEATETRALTEEGTIVGTLQYMAPEQLQGMPTDARSDIFSFGCVLYEILKGKRAFRGDNQATLIAAIIDREPEPLTVPHPMLERIVKKCFAKDPDDRWQSASDLKSELQWVMESGSSPGMPAPVLKTRGPNPGWILSGLLAALLAGFAIFHFRTAPAPAGIARFEIPPPEGASWGLIDFPNISPDGSRIIFGATKADGSRSLWMRSMDSIHAQPIPGIGDTAVVNAAWSPDGRSIVVPTPTGLLRLDLNGGSSQMLGSVPPSGLMPAWGSAGIILFTGREAPSALYQIPASAGEVKPAMSTGASEYFPSFLPDGRRFLYRVFGAGDAGIYLGALDSKEGKPIGAGSSALFVPPSWLLYVRGSTLVAQWFDPDKATLSGDAIPIAEQVALIAAAGPSGGAFSVSQNGVLAYRRALPSTSTELTWYDRNGKKLGTVGEEAVYTNPALSPDGKRLAVGRLDPSAGTRDIWVIDLVRNVSSRFTFDKADDTNPVWSPDGSRIAYSSAHKKANLRDLFWKAAGGAGAEELVLEDGGNKALEDWSPDGKLLLYNIASHDIAAMPVSGDRKPFPVLKAEFAEDHGRVSPDGHWIAYASRESGRDEIFVQNFPPSGGKWQISNTGATEPSWRRDGKELYFISGSKFKAVEVKASGENFEAGIPKDLFDVQLDTTNRRNRYVAAPDGQRFLFVTVPKRVDTAPFVVVQNWQSSLKH